MYFQAVNHPGTILAQQGLTSGIERVPVFSLWYDRRQETFVNICHIVVPKEETVNFNNYKSRSIFNKILQKTKR